MAGLISILREVHDPRDMNARHDLASVLFLALAATLCGAKSCVEMAEFADGNVEELSAMVPLPHGAPSHDTFSRVFRLLDPAELARAFAAFMAALREELGLGPARGVVAVDAKSLRRGVLRPAPMTRLYAEMARTVRARKAHYCLGLKGNRGPLHGAVEAAFAKAGEKAGEDAPFHETTESRHGRQERRRASVLPATALEATHAFPGLVAVGRIEASRTRDGATTQATRYLLLSRRLSPRKLLDTVRAHWSIENHLHWTLDVVFDEDDARSRKNYAPENLAVIRRLALNILNAHPDKRSTASKMRQAKWKQQYFLSLFAHLQ